MVKALMKSYDLVRLSLATADCTYMYFGEGQFCNLYSGARAAWAQAGVSTVYDANCFVCPSSCAAISPPPSSDACGVPAVNLGGTHLLSLNSGAAIQGLSLCADSWYVHQPADKASFYMP